MMITDELVERVARQISPEFWTPAMISLRPEAWANFKCQIRAALSVAVPVIVERCAEEAEDHAGDVSSGAVGRIAAAIRSLSTIKTSGETGR